MEGFAKIVSNSHSLTIFVKHSILDIFQGSEYASVSLSINRNHRETQYCKESEKVVTKKKSKTY